MTGLATSKKRNGTMMNTKEWGRSSMVDFDKLLKEHERDEERGYEEVKQTVMRCPWCKKDVVYTGYIYTPGVCREHWREVEMEIIKRHVVRVPV